MTAQETSILLRAPRGARRVSYGPNDLAFGVDPDGTFGAPRFAVPELLQKGCARGDGKDEPIDIGAELAIASAGDLVTFLSAHGISRASLHEISTDLHRQQGPLLPAETLRAKALELLKA